MVDSELKQALSDLQVAALTMYGEARGDASEGGSSVEERIAVGCVIRNRVNTPRRFGRSFRSVCLARSQFSCWWTWGGKSNYDHLMGLARMELEVGPAPQLSASEIGLLAETWYLAHGILDDIILDSTRGSTHYYSPRAMVPPGRVPEWAKHNTLRAKIGGHLFFKA